MLKLCFVFEGLTETCAGSFCCVPNNMSMIGTVGVPSPSVEVRLESVPEMGYDALGAVPQGEICMRSLWTTGSPGQQHRKHRKCEDTQ